jgi:hypothetical protein
MQEAQPHTGNGMMLLMLLPDCRVTKWGIHDKRRCTISGKHLFLVDILVILAYLLLGPRYIC